MSYFLPGQQVEHAFNPKRLQNWEVPKEDVKQLPMVLALGTFNHAVGRLALFLMTRGTSKMVSVHGLRNGCSIQPWKFTSTALHIPLSPLRSKPSFQQSAVPFPHAARCDQDHQCLHNKAGGASKDPTSLAHREHLHPPDTARHHGIQGHPDQLPAHQHRAHQDVRGQGHQGGLVLLTTTSAF
ncbi:flagellum-associated protein 126, partial [Haematococcus lacustris]